MRIANYVVATVVCCGSLALSAPGVLAVTASVSGNTVTVTGGDEVNDVHVSEVNAYPNPGYQLRIDDSAGVTAGSGCTASATTTLHCGDQTTTAVNVSLGGGDDSFTTRDQIVFLQVRDITVDGGAGNDVLDLYSEGATDTVQGGDGNDTITGGGPDGIGHGSTSTINGGTGDDRITGGEADDTIHGDDGNDTIDGGGGNNTMYGDAGTDTITAGEGADTVNVFDGEADTVTCNILGNDTVNADQFDSFNKVDCAHANVTRFGGSSCPAGETGTPPNCTPNAPSGNAKLSVSRTQSRQKVLKSRHLTATIGCSTACAIIAGADIKIGHAKPFFVHSKVKQLAGAGSAKLSLVLSKKQLAKIRAGLRAHQKVIAAVAGALVDTTTGKVLSTTPSRKVTISG